MNKVVLMGRLTKDIELRQTNSGIAFAGFSVAVTRKFKNADGEYESDFFDCTAWRTTAENLAKYFKKGNRILIDGELQTSQFEKDGQKIKKTVVLVNGFDFIEKADKTANNERKKVEPSEMATMTEDELPF